MRDQYEIGGWSRLLRERDYVAMAIRGFLHSKLFVAESYDWIDLRGAAGGNYTSG
jgi:hypothetical protein